MTPVRNCRLCGENTLRKYTVKLFPRALRDLDSIYGYIAHTLREPAVAEKLIGDIEKGILSLEQLPYRCSERTVGAYAHRGYRQLLIRNYTVIYRIDEANKEVLVVTIRYSRSQF